MKNNVQLDTTVSGLEAKKQNVLLGRIAQLECLNLLIAVPGPGVSPKEGQLLVTLYLPDTTMTQSRRLLNSVLEDIGVIRARPQEW